MAVRFPSGNTWLCDCGEATQHQAQRTPAVRLSKVKVVLITHLHGDHVNGLPGLLCTVSASSDVPEGATKTVTVVGTPGTAALLSGALAGTHSFLGFNLAVVELVQEAAPPEGPLRRRVDATPDDGEQGVRPFALRFTVHELRQQDGRWRIPVPVGAEGDIASLSAASIDHKDVPCVGYVVQEPDTPGSLCMRAIQPRLKANTEALKKAGVKNPGVLLGKLKSGTVVELPDGSTLDPADPTVIAPPTPGRKTCLLGDLSAASDAMAELAAACTVMVHEATNAKTVEDGDTPYEAIEAKAISHGHSTPLMAGALAKAVNASHLVLTHFSARCVLLCAWLARSGSLPLRCHPWFCSLNARYKGDRTPDSLAAMDVLRDQAAAAFGVDGDSGRVVCARDLLSVHFNPKTGIAVEDPLLVDAAGAGAGTGAGAGAGAGKATSA